MKKLLCILSGLICFSAWADNSIGEGIRFFNAGEYDIAQVIFEKIAAQDDAYATFWLGVTQYKKGELFESGDTILRAAEMGDPWAMGVMGGGSLYIDPLCGFFGQPCDEAWKTRAIEEWEKLAKQGDGKALFALKVTLNEWWEFVPFYRTQQYQKIAKQGVAKGGYAFLKHNKYWSSPELWLKYATLAAERGHAPSMIGLYYQMDVIGIDNANKWINRAIKLGYAKAAEIMFNTYYLGRKEVNIKPNAKKAYYYNRLSGALGGEESEAWLIVERIVRGTDGQPIRGENDNYIYETLVSEQERLEMDKQVEEFVKDIKPNMFLDETSIDLF